MALFTPSMPALVHFYSTTHVKVKLALSLFLFSYGISQFFYGPLSDKYGRKPIIYTALCIMIMGNTISVQAGNISLFILGHAIAGFGAGVGSCLARAIMQESHNHSEFSRNFAWVMIAASIGSNSGPFIGGFVQQYLGWHAGFYLLILVSLILMVMIYFLLPETNQHHKNTSFKTLFFSYFSLLKDKHYMAHALIIGLIFGLTISYYSLTPFLYQKVLNLSPQTNWILDTVYYFLPFSWFRGF